MPRPEKCICPMWPGHEFPNQELYILDHRCPMHGEHKLHAVWGRHKELQLEIKPDIYKILSGG